METPRNITQFGRTPLYIEKNEGEIIINNISPSKLSNNKIIECFNSASVDLKEYPNKFGGKKHIERTETEQLLSWILSDLEKDKSPIGILAGNAGYGKSVILHDLYQRLKETNIPVLGIKADRLTIKNLKELKEELQLCDSIEAIFKKIAQKYTRLVFLIDQIDALSQSLSSDRSPINTYHRIINSLSYIPNIRIIVSCRIYDLDYDPILQQYRSKQIFKTSALSILQVEEVLGELKYDVKLISSSLKEFLRIPLHLQIYCKLNNHESFVDPITLQNLYDALWEEYIITKPAQNQLEPIRIVKFIEELSDKMYSEQQIVADSRLFIDNYKKEIEYLNTNEIINKSTSNKIQFVHQSFFDYAFARLFIQRGEKLSEKLQQQHQGLFVRSKIKQVLNYLRELEPKQYIKEVETILFNNYRFHIQLLIINNLGFYEIPIPEEKHFFKNKLINNSNYLKLFIEAIHSCKWYEFIIKEIDIKPYFLNNNEEFINVFFRLCGKVIEKCPINVITFLSSLPEKYEGKNLFIGRTLLSINENDVETAFKLFHQTKQQWDEFSYYHFLEKSIKNHPEFVITELRQKLLEYSNNENSFRKNNAIPGSHDSARIYKGLYEKHPDISIPYFIEVVNIIAERSKITRKDKVENEIFSDWAFYHYVPFKDNNHDLNYEIYDIILKHFTKKFDSDSFEEVKNQILPLLNSKLTSVLSIPLTFFIKYPQNFINEIFTLLTSAGFLVNYSHLNQFFTYQVRELLKSSYSFFSEEQKQLINQIILNVIPKYEITKKGTYQPKGVSQYGYTMFGLSQHHLLSMIPENERKQYPKINQRFNELYRKFGEVKNSRPEGIVVRSGEIVMEPQAYEKMTYQEWKKSFRKYIDTERRPWDGVSELGHNRKFEEIVSKEPDKYFNLIDEIIEDETISQSYVVYGLQGLSKGEYNPTKTCRLFLKCLEYRKNKLEREYLLYLVWLCEFFINKDAVNDEIIDFLIEIVQNYPDSKSLNNDLIFDGINSVRGAAVDRLVRCFKFKQYQEQIFSTLEGIAKSSAPHTRASALLHLAVLNNLDKDRNLKLFLALNHDFHPKLISIELHDGNPLRYFFTTQDDYLKLVPFITKSIEIEEAHSVMTHVIIWAWLSNYSDSENLLNTVLESSLNAKKKAVEVAFGHLPYPEYFSKSLELLKHFLNIDNKELGDEYEHQFIHLSPALFNNLYDFLTEYAKSEVGKYREYYFYQYLLKSSKDEPEKCIELALNFKAHLKPDIQQRMLRNEPLQVVIQAYNAIREYKVETNYLESAMDVFDEMLKVPEYRGTALDVLRKLDA